MTTSSNSSRTSPSTQAGKSSAHPDEDEDRKHELGEEPNPRRDKREERKRRGPSAKKERGSEAGDGKHGQIFAEEEERKFEAGIFSVIAGDKLRLAFRQIEGRAVGFSRGCDR